MKTYNETHDFTHRNPTYLTKKQLERDSKIVKQIVTAYDVECDNERCLISSSRSVIFYQILDFGRLCVPYGVLPAITAMLKGSNNS